MSCTCLFLTLREAHVRTRFLFLIRFLWFLGRNGSKDPYSSIQNKGMFRIKQVISKRYTLWGISQKMVSMGQNGYVLCTLTSSLLSQTKSESDSKNYGKFLFENNFYKHQSDT